VNNLGANGCIVSNSRSLQEVALAALQALKDRRAFTQVEIAKRLNTAPAAVSETLSGKRRVTLRFLEAVSDVTGIHPGEFLVDPHRDQLKVIDPLEMQVLRYFRSWPAPTREALLSFASFFADEEPATADERRAHEQIRRLGDGKRRLAFAYLTFLTEGDLPPDIRKGLGLPEIDGPQSTRPRRVKPTTPTTTKRA
jgi:transcriptional regulator with XRE-family HTH domain